MKRILITAAAAAGLVLAVTPPASAQLGGLIKKKVADAVKAPEKKSETSAKSEGGLPSGTIEITPPVLEGFLRGLQTEIRLTKEFRAVLAKYPTEQEFSRCNANVLVSPEGLKIAVAQPSPPENASVEELMRYATKLEKDLEPLRKKMCPLNPADWPSEKRAERMKAIKVEAAAATGIDAPGSAHETFELEGDSEGDVSWAPFHAPFAAAALTPEQYAQLLERIERFCEELKTNAALGKGGSGGVKFPGSGSVFWVYTAQEAQTLSQANCQRVYDLVGQMVPL